VVRTARVISDGAERVGRRRPLRVRSEDPLRPVDRRLLVERDRPRDCLRER